MPNEFFSRFSIMIGIESDSVGVARCMLRSENKVLKNAFKRFSLPVTEGGYGKRG